MAIRYLITLIITAFIIYLGFSFIELNFNALKWEQNARESFFGITLSVNVFMFFVTYKH